MGKISSTPLIETPQGADRLPMGRAGNTTARTVSLDQVKGFVLGGAMATDPNAVHKTGDETVVGNKTFAAAPITPNDVRYYMDGQNGRPTLASWQSDKSTDVTAAFQYMVDSIPVNGGAVFVLPAETFVTGPIYVTNRAVELKSASGTPTGTAGQPIFAGRPTVKLKNSATDHHFTLDGEKSQLILTGVQLDGNKTNQTFISHGVYCSGTGDTFAESAALAGAVVKNYKGDGIHCERNRNNLWVTNRSYILNNDGHGVYGNEITDTRIWESDIGFSGLSNIYVVGSASRATENIRVALCDIYNSGQLSNVADAANIYVDDYVRSVYVTASDNLEAWTYGVYVKEDSISNCVVGIVGGRFTRNSYAADNTYSDIYAGHGGVSLTGSSHQNPGATNLIKHIIEASFQILDGVSAVGVFNIIYDSTTYRTAPINYNAKAQWMTKQRTFWARGQFMKFSQTAQTDSIIESYGPGGATYVQMQSTGKMNFGDGTNPTDASFSRVSAGVLGVTGNAFSMLGHLVSYGTAAPTTGTWIAGDRRFHSAPAVGQPKGWICTVSGTPGTWVSEGNL